MSKYTYTVWLEYGFTVKSDKLFNLDDTGDYYELTGLATDRLNEIGLEEILSEASMNDIAIEEGESND